MPVFLDGPIKGVSKSNFCPDSSKCNSLALFFSYICVQVNPFASILMFLFLAKGMLPGIDLGCEIQKIPNLLSHYKEHNENTFWEFLEEHYLNNDIQTQHEDPEHENLPFHGNQHCSHLALFYLSEEHILLLDLGLAMQINFSFFNVFCYFEFLDSPFQPPKAKFKLFQ